MSSNPGVNFLPGTAHPAEVQVSPASIDAAAQGHVRERLTAAQWVFERHLAWIDPHKPPDAMKTTQVATLFCCLFLIGSAEVVAGPMMGAMSADLGVRSSAIAYLPAAYGLAYGAFALIDLLVLVLERERRIGGAGGHGQFAVLRLGGRQGAESHHGGGKAKRQGAAGGGHAGSLGAGGGFWGGRGF